MTPEQVLEAIKSNKELLYCSPTGLRTISPQGVFFVPTWENTGRFVAFSMALDSFEDNTEKTALITQLFSPADSERIKAEIERLKAEAQKEINAINKKLSEDVSKLTAKAE